MKIKPNNESKEEAFERYQQERMAMNERFLQQIAKFTDKMSKNALDSSLPNE